MRADPPSLLLLIPGLLVVVLTILAVFRRVDVRLALFLAALCLGTLAGHPSYIVRAFIATLTDGKFIIPICCAMGFAQTLRFFECDRHLVQALVAPLRPVRILLIPGAVVVGFLVNIPIVSQASTVATIGAVLMPLLFAAEISPVTAGAAMLLGASIGGELLNPGAPEFGTIVRENGGSVTRAACAAHAVPLAVVQLSVALLLFWYLSLRAERAVRSNAESAPTAPPLAEERFRIDPLKALVPLVPLVILFVTTRPFGWIVLKESLLVGTREVAELLPAARTARAHDLFDTRLIGLAMLCGTACAALTGLRDWRHRGALLQTGRVFFEGAGFAFTEIISIIAVATCFAEGISLIGLSALLGRLAGQFPAVLLPAATLIPMGFAGISGSGMAATQGLYALYVSPALAQGMDPVHVGALVAVSAAAGRTMCPFAAVCLMSARLAGADPIALARRVALPCLCGVLASLLLATLIARRYEGSRPGLPARSARPGRADPASGATGLRRKSDLASGRLPDAHSGLLRQEQQRP